MSDDYRTQRRTNPRYRLSAPPEVEILHNDSGSPVHATLCDLSRGGCLVETDFALPLGTEVSVTLKKSGDHVRARAQVMRVSSDKGLALEFTSMEGEEFLILQSWLSAFVATSWVAGSRRRSERVAMQLEVRVSGYNDKGERFTEDTRTVVVSASGCLIVIRTAVRRGQILVLSNTKTRKIAECMVAFHEAKGAERQVGLAFTEPNPTFWPTDVAATDGSQ